MSEKRYKFGIIKGSRQEHIIDRHTCKSATIDVYDDNIKYFVDKLNELAEENEALKKFIKDNFTKMMDSKMVINDE